MLCTVKVLLYQSCNYDFVLKDLQNKYQQKLESPKRIKIQPAENTHFSKDIFKVNNIDQPLFCEYCGEMIRKGKLSIFRYDKGQIHFDHIKKNN